MSSILAADSALELLDNFKATVQDLAARAAKLSETMLATQARERRRFETTVEEHKKQLAAAIDTAEAAFQSAKADAQTNYQKRKARIGRAYQASKEQGLHKVDERVGATRYEMQKKMLQAEKDRDAELAATNSGLQQVQRDLAAEQEALAKLEGQAQRAFSGYGGFQRLFLGAYATAQAEASGDEKKLLSDLREQIAKARNELERFRRFLLLVILRFFPVWIVVLLGGLVLGILYYRSQTVSQVQAVAVAGGAVLVFGLRLLCQARARSVVASISNALANARRLHDASQQQADAHYRQALERIQTDFANITRAADEQVKRAQSKASQERVSCRMKYDERTVKVTARHEQHSRAWAARLEKEYGNTIQGLKRDAEAKIQALTDSWEERQRNLATERETSLRGLEEEWRARLTPFYQTVETADRESQKLFPAWDSPTWAHWSPPTEFAQAAKFAELNVDVGKLCDGVPKGGEFALPGPKRVQLPINLAYPKQGSVLFETTDMGHSQAVGALNNVMLRLLSTAPPGRLNFTIIDPIALGQNFAGVMHLADYEEQIINSRIWTQSGQIEQKLADLNEHMEKVIQMYLRNEYQTIAEYNQQAGVIAEKYYFLVIADFPASFTDTAAKRLLSIVSSGPRCGVYTLIHWDRRQPLPQDFIPDELRKSSLCVSWQGKEMLINGRPRPGTQLLLDEPPTAERAIELVHQIGRLSRDSSRVEVPFEQVAPAENELWSEETTSELRVPIGRTGATKLQYLAIGKGTRQHGLIAGKTGSGKSTLFHVIITNLALWSSPEQVEFYLVDFKKGVEFKCYAVKGLPHARVVAIESDREFGLSVLQRVDDELRRRGDMFRQLGVQDLAGYKRAGGAVAIPRTLLLIDEFQEFFVEDDRISQTASLLLDRIVRQGRAFGIHVLLGSQTLGGAYTVARTTLGQMVIRIALQCNEADAYLIMDENNPAPRLLSRPGEGIYNDMAGALEGNSPFQVVWLPEAVRDSYLSRVRSRADQDGRAYPGPIVFEGNAPADVRENSLLRGLLQAPEVKPSAVGRMWLGAPNSIKGPTEAAFRRQSGNNLLIVGQRDEAVLGMFSIGMVSLAAQYAIGKAQFMLFDATPPGTASREYLERIAHIVPHRLTQAKPGDLPEIMRALAEEMKRRGEALDPDAAPPVFLFIHGLQKFSKLRYEEDFSVSSSDTEAESSPGSTFNDLICQGARLGFHVIAACDSYNNVTRFLSRKALSEFEMRVLFQMSANDSASLIDNPKAGLLGLHRALFYNMQEGHLETFRPYALPDKEWVAQVGRDLARLVGEQAPKPAETV